MSDIFTPTRPCDRCGCRIEPKHDCIASLLAKVPKWLPMDTFDLPDFVTVLLTLPEFGIAEGYHSPKGWVAPRIFGFVNPVRWMRMPEPWKESA